MIPVFIYIILYDEMTGEFRFPSKEDSFECLKTM